MKASATIVSLATCVALQATPAVCQIDAGKALAGADVPALIEVLLANADLSGDIVLGIAARERLAERGQLDPQAVVPAVMTALRGASAASRQDQQRRIALMGVLADIGPAAEIAVPLLRDIATDTNERNDFVRQQAAMALANIGTPDAQAARDAGDAVTVEAWLAGANTEATRQAAEEHAFLIRQELRSSQPTDAILEASLDVLHAGGARTAAAASTLLRAWADPRISAATHDRIDSVLRALGTTQPEREAIQLAPVDILDDVIADTRSPYPLVSSLAMMELGRLGPSSRAVAVLTEALRAGRNPGAAALELGQFGEVARPALPALVPYLADDEAGPNAIIAVGRIGDPDRLAVAELRRIVSAAGSRHRGLAASALGELEAAEAVADLASALGDDRTYEPTRAFWRPEHWAISDLAPPMLCPRSQHYWKTMMIRSAPRPPQRSAESAPGRRPRFLLSQYFWTPEMRHRARRRLRPCRRSTRWRRDRRSPPTELATPTQT